METAIRLLCQCVTAHANHERRQLDARRRVARRAAVRAALARIPTPEISFATGMRMEFERRLGLR